MKIILVDDDEVNLTFITKVLQDYEVFSFKDPKKALKYCNDNEFDLVITDMRMPGMSGLALLKDIRKIKTDFVSLVLSAYNDADYLVEAVNANLLYAYIMKPVEPPQLISTVKESLKQLQITREKNEQEKQLAVQAKKLLEENNQLRFNAKSPLEGLVGFNPSVLKIKEQIKSFALSDHPVLITGEEGTGKKLIARIIHELSSRKEKPYVTVSCSTIPQELLETELFGASKNAATGTKQAKDGFIDAAEGGTLFIEGIQELSKTLQSKLLKVLQYGNYYPVGSTEEKTADVRVICSSRTALLKEVEDGSFRKELYYKIANLQIKTTPLRERREDVLALMETVAQKSSKAIPPLGLKEKELLVHYAYPGNIRELEGILEKININVRSSKKESPSAEDIESILKENAQIYALEQGDKAFVRTVQLPSPHEEVDMGKFVDEIEREIITTALQYNENNISQTARNLCISRQGLKNKIKRFSIPVDID